jgi:hypothetical protein
MTRLSGYSPSWAPLRAYYRLGYGSGDEWYWVDMIEYGYVNGD